MRDLAVLTFVTLDGVMQAPARPDEDTAGGFAHGGWATPWWDEVMAEVREVAMAFPYDLLLGRRTYESFAAHFTTAEEAHASPLNQARKYVATSSLTDLAWQNSVSCAGKLGGRGGKAKGAGRATPASSRQLAPDPVAAGK